MPDSEPGHQAADEVQTKEWLRAFDKAPESTRFGLLREGLETGTLSPDRLAPAAVALSQLLAERNQLAQLGELVDYLAAKAPVLHELLAPAWNQLQIQEALFAGQELALPALLAPLAQAHESLPGEQWAQLLDELAFYGQGTLAADLARRLGEAIGEVALADDEDLTYALEKHQVFTAMDVFWRGPRAEADHQAFLAALKGADIEEEDFEALVLLRDADEANQISKLKQVFRERDLAAAQLPAQLAFAHWMQRRHGLDVISSMAMMEQAFSLWEISPEAKRPEFAKWAKIASKDFDELLADLSHHEAHDAFVLLWGLPHVSDWLADTGLGNPFVSHHLASLLPGPKQTLMNERAGSLWTAAFVHRWPRPEAVPEAVFATEAERFRASHDLSEPLAGGA